jgi:signal peptidase I
MSGDPIGAFFIALLALIPGAGHFVLKRRRTAWILFSAGVFFAAFCFATLFSRLNNIAINLLTLTIVVSVVLCSYDLQLRNSFVVGLPSPVRILGAALLCISVLSIGNLMVNLIPYSVGWQMYDFTQTAHPSQFIFRPGDRIVVDEHASIASVKRGQIVSYELPWTAATAPTTYGGDDGRVVPPDNTNVYGEIIAKEGDAVEARNGRLYVNGKLLESDMTRRYPLNGTVSAPPQKIPKGFVVTIPAYTCTTVWGDQSGTLVYIVDTNTPYYVTSKVNGRVIGILNPANRRRFY